MGIMNIFGKKTPPPIEEPQIKRSLLRGPDGKFISKTGLKTIKKKEEKKVKEPVPKTVKIQAPSAPITVTFFGREIRKVYDEKKWYFAVEDILALAIPITGNERVNRKKTFENVKKSVSKTIDKTIYADAEGSIKLIKEIEGEFPGPLPRWLTESSQLPYEAPPKVQKAIPSGETPSSNPSDRGM